MPDLLRGFANMPVDGCDQTEVIQHCGSEQETQITQVSERSFAEVDSRPQTHFRLLDIQRNRSLRLPKVYQQCPD